MSEESINVSGDMDAPLRSAGGANRFSFDLQRCVQMTDGFFTDIELIWFYFILNCSIPGYNNLPSPSELLQQIRQSLRPWSVFFNLGNFKMATSMQRLNNRIQRNLSYFQSNYIFIFIVLMIYCL